MTPPPDVDTYLAGFPEDVREILQQVRATITAALPDPGEKIKYGMALFTSGDTEVIYFGGWKRHVGLYPVPRGDEEFEAAVGPYRAAKDTVQFVYRKPIPYDLLTRITEQALSRH